MYDFVANAFAAVTSCIILLPSTGVWTIVLRVHATEFRMVSIVLFGPNNVIVDLNYVIL